MTSFGCRQKQKADPSEVRFLLRERKTDAENLLQPS